METEKNIASIIEDRYNSYSIFFCKPRMGFFSVRDRPNIEILREGSVERQSNFVSIEYT